MSRVARGKVFYGWWVILACVGIGAYASGMFFYGLTTLFDPIIEEFGWAATATAVMFSMRSMEGGFASPFVGFLVDRFGCRGITLIGVVLCGAGAVLLSFTNALWNFYLLFAVVAVGLSFTVPIPGIAAAARWFIRKRSRAIGLVVLGPGFGGLMVPVLSWLIGAYGWRTALVVAGIGMWAIGIPLAMLIKDSPEQHGVLPDGDQPQPQRPGPGNAATAPVPMQDAITSEREFTAGQVLRTRVFWLLSFGLALQSLSTYAALGFVVPAATSIGISPYVGALMVMFTTLASLVGRFGFGWLGDIYNKKALLVFVFGLQGVGVLMLAFAGSLWQVAVFALMFGPAYGAAVTLRAAFQADYFGTRGFASVQGMLMGLITMSGIFSPIFVGWMFDTRGDYRLAFVILGLLCFAGAVPILFVKQPKVPARVAVTR